MDSDSDDIDHAKPSDLRSMIIFGLDKLHSSTCNESEKTEAMPEISKLVREALEQRYNQGQSAQNENSISNDDLEENFYTFQGQDFSSKRRKYDDEQEQTMAADHAVLDSWIQKLGAVSDHVSTRQRESHTSGESRLDDYHMSKQRKSEERKKAKWESLGYKSLAVQDPGVIAGDSTTDVKESNVHLVFGDCTRPSHSMKNPAIIFSIVDNSGTWGRGGMFSALNRLSPHIEKIYEAAHAAGDLHMGDFHLLPLDVDEDEKPPGTEGERKLYVGLGVVQSYDARRKIPRSDISIPALEVCLRKAAKSATAMSASIHMPRISSHPRQDRKEWYAIERLLRKHAGLNSVDIYVYYYKQPDEDKD